MWAAVERTARAAAANGVAWAILPRDAAHARRCVELGCRILSIGMDAWAFQKGIAAVQGDFAEFFGEHIGCRVAVAAVGDRVGSPNERSVTLDGYFYLNCRRCIHERNSEHT